MHGPGVASSLPVNDTPVAGGDGSYITDAPTTQQNMPPAPHPVDVLELEFPRSEGG